MSIVVVIGDKMISSRDANLIRKERWETIMEV